MTRRRPGSPAALRFEEGAAAARRHLAEGDPRAMSVGEPCGDWLNPRVGLPRGWIGCEIDHSTIPWLDGYYSEIDRARADGRLAPYDLSHRVITREQAVAYLAAGPTLTLTHETPPLFAAGGRFEIVFTRLEIGGARPAPWYAAAPPEQVEVRVIDWRTATERSLTWFAGGTRAVLVHEGATLLVEEETLRGIEYATFDLEHARRLQTV